MTRLTGATVIGLRHATAAVLRHARAAAATTAALVLAGGTLLASAPAARADSIAVTPTAAVLYTFTQFTVSGAVNPEGASDGFVQVTFGGANLGDFPNDLDNGTFNLTFTLPLRDVDGQPVIPRCGANAVTVTALSESPADDVLVGSTSISLGCASIAVSPNVVGNQQLPATFQVTPQNFPSAGGFALTVDGTPQGFTTTAGGGLDFTSSPSCGAHQVTLSQTFNEQLISASAQITVLCPQITLTPAAVPLASQPATVLVTGGQFHPNQPVTISLNGANVGSTVTDETGSFSLPITAARLNCAAHQVTASEQTTQGGPTFLFSASAQLQVTACQQTLAVDPAVIRRGELTHVTGTGFAPGIPVTLTWQLPGGGASLLGTLTVTAGTDGNIAAFFLVMPGDLLGARQLVATQGSSKLTADALVGPGPMQPTSGGHLVYRR
jgi:hypothetical protein